MRLLNEPPREAVGLKLMWWNQYEDRTPMVIGHYGRSLHRIERSMLGKGDPDPFDDTAPLAWNGLARQASQRVLRGLFGWRALAESKAGAVVGQDFKLAGCAGPSGWCSSTIDTAR